MINAMTELQNTPGIRTPETNMLIDYLRSVAVGNTALYSEMSSSLNFPVTAPQYRHYLQSALVILERSQIFFKNIPGSGYQRLSQPEAIEHFRKLHSKRLAGDTDLLRERVSGINYDTLDAEAQHTYRAAASEVAMRQIIGSDKMRGIVEIKAKDPASLEINGKDLIREMLDAGFTG